MQDTVKGKASNPITLRLCYSCDRRNGCVEFRYVASMKKLTSIFTPYVLIWEVTLENVLETIYVNGCYIVDRRSVKINTTPFLRRSTDKPIENSWVPYKNHFNDRMGRNVNIII